MILRKKARQSAREEILGIFDHLGARNCDFWQLTASSARGHSEKLVAQNSVGTKMGQLAILGSSLQGYKPGSRSSHVIVVLDVASDRLSGVIAVAFRP